MILVNLNGCAVRAARPVEEGTIVELRGLRVRPIMSARVVNCIRLGEHEKIWLIGLELEASGNWWGIEAVPPDW